MASRSPRSIVSDLLPPVARRVWRRWFRWRWFRGSYANWAEAQRAAGGYAEQAILDRVLRAACEVRAGRAAFERDGVLFAQPQCDVPLLAALEHVALASGGNLRVLDFGGSLGSTWFQVRPFLPPLVNVSWQVVEQPHFVAAGREHLADATLGFHTSLAAACAAGPPDVILISCVLQYVEAPHRWIEEFIALGCPFLLFNNLLVHGAPERLAVQHTPPAIYPASYPVWFLDREGFEAHFRGHYRPVFEFESSAVWDVDGRPHPGHGCLFARATRPAR